MVVHMCIRIARIAYSIMTQLHTFLTTVRYTIEVTIVVFAVAFVFHRVLGYGVGRLLTYLLGTPSGAFQFEVGWIGLRLGLDQNELVIAEFKWKNPPEFTKTPYLFEVKQLILRFKWDTLLKALVTGTSIRVYHLEIDTVIFYMEKEVKVENSEQIDSASPLQKQNLSNQRARLNMWAAFGAENVEQEKSVETFFQKCISKGREAQSKAEKVASTASKYNPVKMLEQLKKQSNHKSFTVLEMIALHEEAEALMAEGAQLNPDEDMDTSIDRSGLDLDDDGDKDFLLDDSLHSSREDGSDENALAVTPPVTPNSVASPRPNGNANASHSPIDRNRRNSSANMSVAPADVAPGGLGLDPTARDQHTKPESDGRVAAAEVIEDRSAHWYVPYTFEVEYLNARNLQLFAQDYLNANHSDMATMQSRAVKLATFRMSKAELTEPPRKWNPGKIKKDRGNGTFDISYDDGEVEFEVPGQSIRVRKSIGSIRRSSSTNLRVGSKVEVQRLKWFPCKITRVWDLNTHFDICYEDGVLEQHVPEMFLRLPDDSQSTPNTRGRSSSSTSGKDTASGAVPAVPHRRKDKQSKLISQRFIRFPDISARTKKNLEEGDWVESCYRSHGLFLDDLTWRVVGRLLQDLFNSNKIAMATILANAAANQTKAAMMETAQTVANTVKEELRNTKDKAANVANTVKEELRHTKAAVVDTAMGVKDDFKCAKSTVVDTAHTVARCVKDDLENTKTAVLETSKSVARGVAAELLTYNPKHMMSGMTKIGNKALTAMKLKPQKDHGYQLSEMVRAHNISCLRVRLYAAHGVRLGGRAVSACFCLLRLQSQRGEVEEFKSSVRKANDTGFVSWDEEFELGPIYTLKAELNIQVFESKMFAKDAFVCELRLPLEIGAELLEYDWEREQYEESLKAGAAKDPRSGCVGLRREGRMSHRLGGRRDSPRDSDGSIELGLELQ